MEKHSLTLRRRAKDREGRSQEPGKKRTPIRIHGLVKIEAKVGAGDVEIVGGVVAQPEARGKSFEKAKRDGDGPDDDAQEPQIFLRVRSFAPERELADRHAEELEPFFPVQGPSHQRGAACFISAKKQNTIPYSSRSPQADGTGYGAGSDRERGESFGHAKSAGSSTPAPAAGYYNFPVQKAEEIQSGARELSERVGRD